MLVTGATGYIGGRLVRVLEASAVRLRCLARHPAALESRVSPTTEVVTGDLFDPASLDRALAGIDVAYYLVHSMGDHGDYLEKDRLAARSFGEAARRPGSYASTRQKSSVSLFGGLLRAIARRALERRE